MLLGRWSDWNGKWLQVSCLYAFRRHASCMLVDQRLYHIAHQSEHQELGVDLFVRLKADHTLCECERLINIV